MTTRMFLGIVIQQVISVVTKELWNGTMRRVFGFFYLTEHHCEGTSSVPDGILKYYEGSVKQCEAFFFSQMAVEFISLINNGPGKN